ncbi:dihydrodipicolinate synthase family protein [Phytoactinopolyspora endophytica]|uniref:dihydrodipicolinate synthase family protein n=1 Tax=Phytoactinopolyspora endophytica TaxID=1642495 RepID=UPI00101C0A93|nr:dihydrodipicolinate synthase family protein [Phytoactinopolyspora endophytica]
MELTDALRSVVAVLVTPYRNGTQTVDEEVCAELTAHVDGGGVPAITALGNTAEVHRLSAAERTAVLRGVATGRTDAVLLAGLTGPSTTMLYEAELAASLGYDAVMVHQPPDPLGGGSDQVALWREVADQSPLPVVPYLRSTDPAADDLVALVEHPAVVGVKFARPDLGTLAALLRTPSAQACVWMNGNAEATVPSTAALGLTGFTSGIANARPDAALAVYDAVRAGDLHRLAALLRLIGPVEELRSRDRGRNNVAVIKEMLRRQGFDLGGVRAPHAALDPDAASVLNGVLDTWPDDLRTEVQAVS